MDDPDLVRLRVRLQPGDGAPAGELLWASPVDTTDTAGIYRLENHAFMATLAAGGVVAAQRDGSGCLQIVDIVRPAPAVLTLVGVVWDVPLDVDALMARWSSEG